MRPTIAFITDAALAAAQPRIRYVLDALERHPLAPPGLQCLLSAEAPPEAAVVCYYGNENRPAGQAVFIPAQRHFFCSQPTTRISAALNSFDFQGKEVHAVQPDSSAVTNAFFATESGKGRFGFDWLETLFFHLSRWEEYAPAPEELDDIGIMKSSAQLLPRHGLHHVPVADRLIEAVFRALQLTENKIVTTFSISHDVDDLQVFGAGFRLPRYLAGVAWRHRTPRNWPRIVSDYLQVRSGRMRDPGDTFDWLLHAGKAAEKTVYFGTGNHSRFDHFPALDAPRLKEVRELAFKQGYKAGLHPGYETWKNPELLEQQRGTLENWLEMPVVKSRQHYLRFAFPETADALETAGIQEDATLGFRDRIGFRAGTGFPFYLYCFREERPYRWLEKPLIAMDCGLVRENGGDPKQVRRNWHDFITQNGEGTAISLSLHNTYLYEQDLHGIDFRSLFGMVFTNQNHAA